MKLNLVYPPRNTVAGGVVDGTLEHRVLACLREASRRVFGKQELAARAFGVSPGHFARQLAGHDNVTVKQLARAPELLREWSALLAKANGHRLARHLSGAQRRRRIAMRRYALEVARLELAEALAEDDALSGAPSVLAG